MFSVPQWFKKFTFGELASLGSEFKGSNASRSKVQGFQSLFKLFTIRYSLFTFPLFVIHFPLSVPPGKPVAQYTMLYPQGYASNRIKGIIKKESLL